MNSYLKVDRRFGRRIWKKVLEKCMIDGGNYYLSSGLVEMGAEANVGTSWYEAK